MAGSLGLWFVGAGVLRKFGTDIFCVFLASIFQKNGMFKPVFVKIFGAQIFVPIFVQIFGAQMFAPIFTQIFGAQIFVQIFRRFSSTFWHKKNRCSRVTRKCAEHLRKNLRRPNGPARGRGTSFYLRFLEQTARHTIAARPTYSRRACDIFGPKGILAFAPRFFKN